MFSHLRILAEDRETIAYRPRLRALTGSVTATILLQQIIYWAQRLEWKPFYKFNQPCGHDAYQTGDSWCEELGMSYDEFRTARDKIARKVRKGEVDEALRRSAIIYWTDADRKTYYQVNPEILEYILRSFYEGREMDVSSVFSSEPWGEGEDGVAEAGTPRAESPEAESIEEESPEADPPEDEASAERAPKSSATHRMSIGGSRSGVDDREDEEEPSEAPDDLGQDEPSEAEQAARVAAWRAGAGEPPWDPSQVAECLSTAENRQDANGLCVEMLLSLYGTDEHEPGEVWGWVAKLTREMESYSGRSGQGPRLFADTLLALTVPPPPGSDRADFRPWENETRRKSLPKDVLAYIKAALSRREKRGIQPSTDANLTHAQRANRDVNRRAAELHVDKDEWNEWLRTDEGRAYADKHGLEVPEPA